MSEGSELDVGFHKVLDRIGAPAGAVHQDPSVAQTSFGWIAFGAVLAGAVVVVVATALVELGCLISLAGYVAHFVFSLVVVSCKINISRRSIPHV